MKFKQVLLNMIIQSIQGLYKGSIRIGAEMTFENSSPSVRVDVENLKVDLQKKDNMRIVKLVQTTDFKTILESKVDINLKIVKLLTNAINWKLDFTSTKGTKVMTKRINIYNNKPTFKVASYATAFPYNNKPMSFTEWA